MSDLISRKDLLEIIAQTKRAFNSENKDYYSGYMCALSGMAGVIAGQQTVYDVGKVVNEIKEIGTRFCVSVHCNNECYVCEHGSIMKTIIENVKGGGVNER